MFDIKWIRENPQAFDKGLKARGIEALSTTILDLDQSFRASQGILQDSLTRRNTLAKLIPEAKKTGAPEADSLVQEALALKEKLSALEEDVREKELALQSLLETLPNLPQEGVPLGKDETDNVEISRFGTPRVFDFTPKAHFDLGEGLGMMDFERATKLSGARFVVLRNQLAKLERAVAAFMIDVHTTTFGYEELYLPLLVNEKTLYGTGQLPKFGEDLYKTQDDLYLVPTAEVSLTNLVAGEILEESSLPIRVTAYTPCFRREAGAAGRDTRGMIRQHQFSKVELVSITTPEQSEAEHERMTAAAEEILKRLELPYRKLLLCSGDMGPSAQKTYDLEVWLPSQNTYREISSCSNCGAYQARRMKTRYRTATGTQAVHTLNGSGLAVGRTMVAILENYQNADGSITVPTVLRPFMNGLETISCV